MFDSMGKYNDLTGKRFGKLVVVKRVEDYIGPSGNRGTQWLCKCDCGNEVVKRGANLCSGSTKSCGCGRAENLVGKKYNMLTVIGRDDNKVYSNGHTYVMWKCKCDCGNIVSVSALHLKNGHTKSCGCLHDNRVKYMNYTHGGKSKDNPDKNRLYSIWSCMKDRCINPNSTSYINYGGRGIKVCDEWENDFESFMIWAINNEYDPHAERGACTLDRIDVNGNYCPDNCRWVNQKTQCNNTRRNIHIEYNDETHTIAEWSDISGLPASIIYSRIRLGWDTEKVFSTPAKTVS